MALHWAMVSELHAQDFFYRKSLTNLRIDQLSQDQVISFQRYVQAKGMSETEASNYLLQKGLSRAEVDKLRKRSGGLSNTSAGSVAGNFEMMDQYFKLRDSLQALAVDTAYPKGHKDRALIRAKQVPDSVIFGSELFAGARLRFNMEGQMVPPLDYRVGPGDVLSILIYGFQEASFELKVQANGKITMPYAGLITVAGLTLEQISEKLKQNLQANGYSKIATGQTKLHVGLADFRQIQVTVVGSTQPGNFMVPSVAKLFHVMHVAGGPSSRSTYRNVELWRNGKLVTTVDLYKLLSGGDFEGNINLQDHDVIYFPPYVRRIMVRGEIRRPALFETKLGEKFSDILAYTGGFTAFAYTQRVWVERVMDGEMRYLTFEGDSLLGFEPQDGDVITVQSVSEKKKGLIQISGAVKRPGDYAHQPGMRLSHLLLHAEALEPTAMLSRVVVAHKTPEGLRSLDHYNLDSVKAGFLDPALLDGDSVIVGSVLDFYPRLPVRVMGEVHREISLPWSSGMTAQDAVFMAGGFKPGFAVDQWIKIARRVELDSLDGRWEISKVIREATDSLLMVRASETLLEEGDVVMVYRNPAYLPLAMVRVEGAFNSPGLFPIKTKSEKIKDMIGRAGGFNAFADQRSLILIRDHEIPMADLQEDARANDAIDISAIQSTGKARVVRTDTIALDWNTLNSGGRQGNFLLKDGDRLVVAEKSEIVLVQGSVNSQVMLSYQGHRMRTYLAGAGGLSESGDPSRVYVRRTNGKMASTKRVLGILTRYPKVYPGDLVVVPIKAPNDEQDQRFDSGKWMAISSVLMSMATVATVVFNSFK
jgi:protein involved in polysaccharide export with SLBB domain